MRQTPAKVGLRRCLAATFEMSTAVTLAHGRRLMAALLVTAIAVMGCGKTPPPAAQAFVCSEFSMPVSKDDWSQLREVMSELSAKIAEPHQFDRYGHIDPAGRRIIRDAIVFNGDHYRIVLGAHVVRDNDLAHLRVFQDVSPARPNPCVKWRKADFDLAKSMFAAKWKIVEVRTEPYPIPDLAKRRSCPPWRWC